MRLSTVFIAAALALGACGGVVYVREERATEVDLHVRVPCTREPCDEPPEPVEVREVGRPRPTMLALGSAHSCALVEDGGIYRWGSNNRGQLGDLGDDTPENPRRVPGLPVMDAVFAGAEMTCAREADRGTLYCWGDTGLGPNRDESFATPLPFENVATAALGYRMGCFVDQGGTVFCWGDYGIPHGPRWDAPRRVPVRGITGLSAGSQRHCGLDERGRITCWGFPFAYWRPERLTEPLWRVEGVDGLTRIVLPPNVPHGRPWVVDRRGAVHHAELGESREHGATHAVRLDTVDDITNPTHLVAGTGHVCARLSNGTAACWGANGSGQVGDGSEATRSQARFLALTGVEEIAAGERHTCARTADALYCWGENGSGQVGVRQPRHVLEPTPIPW